MAIKRFVEFEQEKQKPKYSTRITENICLLLSYDKLQPTEGDFREDLIEFLINNGALSPKCFVATTIYFETVVKEEDKPLTHWSELLYNEFGESFFFHLVRISKAKKTPIYIERKRNELSNNFDKKVEEYLISLVKPN